MDDRAHNPPFGCLIDSTYPLADHATLKGGLEFDIALTGWEVNDDLPR